MKTTELMILVGLTLVVVSTAPAAPRQDALPAAIRRFDKNNDGRIDPQERMAIRQAMQRNQNNPDGNINRAEIVKRFDTNGDGRLDAQEQAAARQAFQNRLNGQNSVPQTGPRSARSGQDRSQAANDPPSRLDKQSLLKQFDRNGNERLDPDERREAIAAAQERNKR